LLFGDVFCCCFGGFCRVVVVVCLFWGFVLEFFCLGQVWFGFTVCGELVLLSCLLFVLWLVVVVCVFCVILSLLFLVCMCCGFFDVFFAIVFVFVLVYGFWLNFALFAMCGCFNNFFWFL